MASSTPNTNAKLGEKDKPKPSSRTRMILITLALTLIFGFIFLMSFLALDVFTLPILTPIAHFIAWILTPIIPFIFPIYLGVFIKVCRVPKREWPGKKRWMFISGAWGFTHLQRATEHTWAIWKGVFRGRGVCGLDRCGWFWLEEGLVEGVLLGEVMGWKWDAGWVDWWVESTILEEKKRAEAEKKEEGGDLEKGGEKTGVVEDERGVDDEKRVLMERDEVVGEREGVLIVLDGEDRVRAVEA